MILFTKESREKILAGKKWQTRKLWARSRAREGAEHLVYLRPPMTGERPFARILVTRVWRQCLGDMTDQEAVAEGYEDRDAFFEQFSRINRAKIKGDLEETQVYALEFHVLQTLV